MLAEIIARYLAELTIRLIGTEKARKLSNEAVQRANSRADEIERARFGKPSG